MGANPVLRAHPKARILVVGQAPGIRVHQTGIPWNDPSGNRLRDWLGVNRETFYNEQLFAIIPMGFCYPGSGERGDLPPRPECAPLWHAKLLEHLPYLELTLLIGNYAQKYYLKGKTKSNLTETVKGWKHYGPGIFPLPHPSPRNNIWLKKNPWFEKHLVRDLRKRIEEIL